MMIISFAWTSPAIVARQKTVTRRSWEPDHARKFHAGDTVRAYDRTPRAQGKAIAILRLTADPVLEDNRLAPDSDYEAEGFAYLTANPGLLPRGSRNMYLHATTREAYDQWRREEGQSWVIRFEILEVLVPLPEPSPSRQAMLSD